MDSVIEKLGFFDFFNYIIVGMFTIVGCFSITYQFGWETSDKIFSYLTNTVEVNTVFLVLCFFSLVTVSYIIGLLCHEIYSLIDRAVNPLNIFKKLIENLFNDNSCIENEIKRKRYTIIAKAIFEKNGIEYSWDLDVHSSKKWSLELNNYFFTYCLYQLQIRGLNRKTEKLRDIEGLAKSFCVSSIILLAVLIAEGIMYRNALPISGRVFWGEVLLLIVICIIFIQYGIKALKNRIRMTLSLYDAIFFRAIND